MAKRILIVDDAAFMRYTLREILTKAGYEVVGEAADGSEGVAKYAELKPDLVTMDITMPELSGIGAVQQIKKIDPEAKIVMISAMGQQAMVLDAVKAGAKNFIIKPFEREKVLTVIGKILEG